MDEDEVAVDSVATTEVEDLPINSHVYFHISNDEDTEEGMEPSPSPPPPLPPTAATNTVSTPPTWSAILKKKIIENFLPLGFAVALIFSLSYPLPGKTLAGYTFMGIYLTQAINNVIVFFISGITLNVNAMAEIREHWRAVVFGILSILFLTPLLGFVFVSIPLQPKEFSLGLAIFCCVPTTLGVGVALTTSAGGNTSVSLVLTVVTNIIGILTMPYMLQFVMLASNSTSADVIHFNPINVFIKLIFTVLIPSFLGFFVSRSSATARSFVAKRRTELSMFSTSNLVCIIWQTLSSASKILLEQSAINIVLVIVLSAFLHIILLTFFFLVTSSRGLLPLPIKERVSVTIMAAQKSAPVAVTLILYIAQSNAQQGLLSVPALIGQLCQIFIGSALVYKFQKLIKADAALRGSAEETRTKV